MAATSTNPVTRACGPGTTNSSQTLYERMGGEEKLDAVVDSVYKAMLADKELGRQFARFRLERLKDRTVDYLRGEWGGTPYKGSDLWISHSHLGVKGSWYDIMTKYYVTALKKHKIGKQESKEILESIEKMRSPICDTDLKFKNMYLAHSAKLAKEAGGDGWNTKTPAQREKEEKEKKEREKKEREKKEQENKDQENKEQENGSDASRPEDKIGENAAETAGLSAVPTTDDEGAARAAAKQLQRAKTRLRTGRARARKFAFAPAEDRPPEQVPSSRPSGAELLYRLSSPPLACRVQMPRKEMKSEGSVVSEKAPTEPERE